MSSWQSGWTENERLLRRLLELTNGTSPGGGPGDNCALRNADAIITHIEVNEKHGVGVLVRTLFRGHSNIISIRSASHFDAESDFGDLTLHISHECKSRESVFDRVLKALRRNTIARVLCVPYYPDDAWTALAIKEIFGIPLCTYIMDDQNICETGIPDSLMRELLAKSKLRLAISPEIYIAYERKYAYKMWLMPPVVPG